MSEKKFNETDRFYSWSLITYSTPLEFQSLFDRVNNYAYIFHDKDKAEPHYHILVTFKREISLKKIRDIINSSSNTFGQPMKDRFNMFAYLTHENLSEEEKAIYEKSDIITNNLKFWLCTEGDKADKNKEFLRDLLSLSSVNLAIKYGRDYILHRGEYTWFRNEVLNIIPVDELSVILDE